MMELRTKGPTIYIHSNNIHPFLVMELRSTTSKLFHIPSVYCNNSQRSSLNALALKQMIFAILLSLPIVGHHSTKSYHSSKHWHDYKYGNTNENRHNVSMNYLGFINLSQMQKLETWSMIKHCQNWEKPTKVQKWILNLELSLRNANSNLASNSQRYHNFFEKSTRCCGMSIISTLCKNFYSIIFSVKLRKKIS